MVALFTIPASSRGSRTRRGNGVLSRRADLLRFARAQSRNRRSLQPPNRTFDSQAGKRKRSLHGSYHDLEETSCKKANLFTEFVSGSRQRQLPVEPNDEVIVAWPSGLPFGMLAHNFDVIDFSSTRASNSFSTIESAQRRQPSDEVEWLAITREENACRAKLLLSPCFVYRTIDTHVPHP